MPASLRPLPLAPWRRLAAAALALPLFAQFVGLSLVCRCGGCPTSKAWGVDANAGRPACCHGDEETTATAAAPACAPTASAKNKAADKAAALCGVATTVKAGQEFSAEVLVTQVADGPAVPGLSFTVKFIHVGMGHGGSKVPMVEEAGGGLYKVTALKPSMAGNWRMTLTAGADAFAFDFKVN
ncbi:MAG: FixH family protein [Deltaproteobacteria bacterium]|nr:FixH family protein [Deltaproteobacteria bacterium]